MLIAGPSANRFRFIGKLGYYYDQDLSELYLRARQYVPSISRFLSVDLLAPINSALYQYARNRPCSWTDPSGHKASGDCLEADFADLDTAFKDACKKAKDESGKCIPPKLSKCLQDLCNGTIHVACFSLCQAPIPKLCSQVDFVNEMDTEQISLDTDFRHNPPPCTRVEIPNGYFPRISICLAYREANGAVTPLYPNNCQGYGEAAAIFHELMHFCFGVHPPAGVSDPITGCDKACYDVGQGDPNDCTCC